MQGNAHDEEPIDPHGECAAEIIRLRSALEAIRSMHPGDQPASSGLSEEQWLRKHIVEMRVKAAEALDNI